MAGVLFGCAFAVEFTELFGFMCRLVWVRFRMTMLGFWVCVLAGVCYCDYDWFARWGGVVWIPLINCWLGWGLLRRIWMPGVGCLIQNSVYACVVLVGGIVSIVFLRLVLRFRRDSDLMVVWSGGLDMGS